MKVSTQGLNSRLQKKKKKKSLKLKLGIIFIIY